MYVLDVRPHELHQRLLFAMFAWPLSHATGLRANLARHKIAILHYNTGHVVCCFWERLV
jgi:hypothetical protein